MVMAEQLCILYWFSLITLEVEDISFIVWVWFFVVFFFEFCEFLTSAESTSLKFSQDLLSWNNCFLLTAA